MENDNYTYEELKEALGASLLLVLEYAVSNPNVISWAKNADSYFFPSECNIIDFSTQLPVKYPTESQSKYEPFKEDVEYKQVLKELAHLKIRIQDLLNQGSEFGEFLLYNPEHMEGIANVLFNVFKVSKREILEELKDKYTNCKTDEFMIWLHDKGARP